MAIKNPWKIPRRLLGTMPDIKLAEQCHAPRSAVEKMRRDAKISSWKRPDSVNWTPYRVALLGAVSDAKLAKRLKVPVWRISDQRKTRGIASLRAKREGPIWLKGATKKSAQRFAGDNRTTRPKAKARKPGPSTAKPSRPSGARAHALLWPDGAPHYLGVRVVRGTNSPVVYVKLSIGKVITGTRHSRLINVLSVTTVFHAYRQLVTELVPQLRLSRGERRLLLAAWPAFVARHPVLLNVITPLE